VQSMKTGVKLSVFSLAKQGGVSLAAAVRPAALDLPHKGKQAIHGMEGGALPVMSPW